MAFIVDDYEYYVLGLIVGNTARVFLPPDGIEESTEESDEND